MPTAHRSFESALLPQLDIRFTTLSELLAQQALTMGERAALDFGEKTYSYARMARRAERAAARLVHEWGVTEGARVLYLGWNHVEQITLLFALARMNGVMAPLNTRLAVSEWQAIALQCTPSLILHDPAFASAALALGAATGIAVQSMEALCAAPVQAAAPDNARADAPALLVYTSGTTGEPKGAVHTQANLLANMAIAADLLQLKATDLIASVLPLFHVGGLCIQTLPALYAGARVSLQPRFEPGAWLDAVQRERPSLSLLVPAAMKALVEHPAWASSNLGSLRAVWAGSSVLPDALVDAFHARGVPVCNVYGATETGPCSIALGPQQAMSHVGSCGWPAPGVECRLQPLVNASEDAGNDARKDPVGEVLLRAPNVVTHYWPKLPACDAAGWFHTGDVATRAPDGSLRIVGRVKEMIISGGENIYPAEIENLLAMHPGVQDCAAVGLPDAQWGEIVCAAVVLREGFAWQPEQLQEFLAQNLARYKCPKRWVLCQALPKTALGKVQRGALQKQLLQK
jgi:fatty-acyl-CoA synthase